MFVRKMYSEGTSIRVKKKEREKQRKKKRKKGTYPRHKGMYPLYTALSPMTRNVPVYSRFGPLHKIPPSSHADRYFEPALHEYTIYYFYYVNFRSIILDLFFL